MTVEAIRPRERDAIIQSLGAGVVPSIGLRHIQVGRKDEVEALIRDLERIEQGGATVRFIIGRYGAGKSFFLNVARMVALERRFVVMQADITPDRRLHASAGQARALYAALLHSLAIRSRPNGGALPAVVERWVSEVDHAAREQGGDDAEVARLIAERLAPLRELVNGYDFVTVVTRYYQGFRAHDERLMAAALRWLRGEYTTRTEARADLGVRTIVDDPNVYEYLTLWAAFVRMAGYAGLLVSFDELGVLSHRLNSAQARNANYEMILRIVNACLQGDIGGIGFLFSGSDAFLDDRRRGLASYEALATRLADNRFALGGLKDLSGPVIRLENLSPEDLYVLLHRIRHVFAGGDPDRYLVPDEALRAFLDYCARTLGSDFFLTPRDSVKAFVGLLAVLEQNPGADWRQLLGATRIERSPDPEALPPPNGAARPPAADDDEDLATLRL